jgi:DNA repair/transcription protein MET18/MMS19
LIACIQSYDPDTVSKYSITIWDVLKFEILNAQEEFLSETSLEALQAITRRLSEGVTEASQDLPLAKYLQPITKECNEQLQEPQNKQAKPSQSILSCVSAASPVSFTLVVQTVVPPIFTLYQEADGIVKQRALLETLNVLFESATTVFGQWTTRGNDISIDNPLLEFRDQFSEIFGQVLMGAAKEEVSFRVTALKGFLRLSTLRDFFQDNEIGLFVQYLDEILLKEESVGRDDLKKEAIAALAEISKHKPRLIMDITFPAFVATLPEEDEGSEALYLPTLETLAQISVERDIFETLFRRLFSKLSILLQKEHTGSVAYPRAILVTLLYVMQQRNMEQDQSIDLYFDKIVVGLCRGVAASASGTAKNRILNDPTVLDTLGRLCNLLVRSVSTEKQGKVAENVYSLFATSDEFVPVPFAQNPSADQQRTIIISTYLLAGISKDCGSQLPHTNPDMSGLLLDLVHRSISSTEPAIHQAYLRHLALLVNKFLSKQDLAIAEKLFDSLLEKQDTDAKSLSPATIRTIFWLAKALILRIAPTTTHVLTSLLALISSPDMQTSVTAAQSFAIILGEDDIISAANGATIRLLCRQRLFTTVIPLISSRIREVNIAGTDDSAAVTKAPDHIKPAHLTALSGILSTIPTALVMPELPTLLPLLLQSLDLQTAGSVAVRAATLDTLAVIIRDNGVAVIDQCGHVQSLVTRLLNTTATNTAPGAVNSPRLRADALACLKLLAVHQSPPGTTPNTRAPPAISPLLPVKNQVLRSLRAVLDDPKRDVRKAAVDARGAWLRGVDDAPEEDE